MTKIVFLLFCILFSAVALAQSEARQNSTVTFSSFIESLNEIATSKLEKSDALAQEFKALAKIHNISASPQNFKEYVRVKLVFEATRDSGLWKIKWAVTDREPNSDHIWKQWQSTSDIDLSAETFSRPSAIAECDELSALFAFIARSLGVRKVGLFWPTWNHTIAVWTAEGQQGEAVRINIPTSQVFLTANASLGTVEFDPYKQKKIYTYDRKDVPRDYEIPYKLVKMMLSQVEKYAEESSEMLQKRRNALSKRLGGS